MSVPSVSTMRMGMARLLANCRARMICMGFGDDTALPLEKTMESGANVDCAASDCLFAREQTKAGQTPCPAFPSAQSLRGISNSLNRDQHTCHRAALFRRP